MLIVRFDANAQVQIQIHRAPSSWVASCDALGITLECDTFEELQRAIHEAINDTFRDLLSEGELEQFLTTHGWKLLTPIDGVSVADATFDLPWGTERASIPAARHAGH